MLFDQSLCPIRIPFVPDEKLIARGSDSNEITWRQFAKETLPNCQPDVKRFTFAEWFYAAAKLVRHHLKEPWQKGLIIGFISKQSATDLLIKCTPGTFLLRFSESAIGKHKLCSPTFDQKRILLNQLNLKLLQSKIK